MQTRRASRLHTELMDRVNDMGSVPCQNAPDTFFFDKEELLSSREKIKMAKSMCADCPLSVLCLEYALEAKEQDGIWGGLTTKERRRFLRGGVAA